MATTTTTTPPQYEDFSSMLFLIATMQCCMIVCFIFCNRRSLLRYAWKLQKLAAYFRQPMLQLTDDLEAVTMDVCSICLESLSSLPAEEQFPPKQPRRLPCKTSLAGHGLLRLPCGHLFHGSCVDKWFSHDVRCPYCRLEVDSMVKCTCICLRRSESRVASPEGGPNANMPSSGGAATDSPKSVAVRDPMEAWGPVLD